MSTLLLFLICIIYIGLGLPDSSLGSSWPAIYLDLNLPISYQSFITIIISIFTTVSCFFSARLINRFGTGIVTAVSTLLSAVGLILFSVSNSMVLLCLSGIPLGFGAGGIDSALNNYVALRYKPWQMNILHCFYGIGVTSSPIIVSLMLVRGGWRNAFFVLFLLLFILSLLAFFMLPLWKKIQNIEKGEMVEPITLSIKQMLKLSSARFAFIAFFATCALEFTCGTWGATYLVNTVLFSPEKSALIVSLYYVGITVSRGLSSLLSTKLKTERIVFMGYSLVITGIVLLFLPLPPMTKGVALLLVGLGNGQTFPNLTLLTPSAFGKAYSQSMVSAEMLFANLGILIMPPLFGVFAQYLSTDILPLYISVLCAVMVAFTILFFKKSKTQKF